MTEPNSIGDQNDLSYSALTDLRAVENLGPGPFRAYSAKRPDFGAVRDRAYESVICRGVIISILLLMHVGIVVALLSAKLPPKTSERAREVVLTLIQPERPVVRKESPKKKNLEAERHLYQYVPQLHEPTAQSSGISGVGDALFNCTFVNPLNKASSEDTNCAHLSMGKPKNNEEFGMPKAPEAHDEVRWSAGLAARQTPARLPCVSLKQGPVPLTGGQKPNTIVMSDLLCAAEHLNGNGAR